MTPSGLPSDRVERETDPCRRAGRFLGIGFNQRAAADTGSPARQRLRTAAWAPSPWFAPVMVRHGFEIRAATPADAPGLATLLAAAGQVADARELADRLAVLRDASGTALVALRWGPPSGLVVLHFYRTLEQARPTAQITTLLVSVEERRRGLGRLLIKAAAQAARSAGCGLLELLAASDAAFLQEFCRGTGFAEIGQRFVRSLRKQGSVSDV